MRAYNYDSLVNAPSELGHLVHGAFTTKTTSGKWWWERVGITEMVYKLDDARHG